MKKRYFVILVLLILLLTGCTNDAVAKVNDVEISQAELDRQMILTEISYSINGYQFPSSGDGLEAVSEDILNNIIEGYILVDLAKKEGIEIDEEAAKSEGSSIIEGLISLYGSEEGYEKFLEEKDQSRDEFDNYIYDMAKDNEYIFDLYDKVTANVTVTDDEVKEYYSENTDYYNYSTRSVMSIQTVDESRAEEIYDDIVDDKLEFEDAVEKYRGTDGVINSLDLGEIYYGSMPEEFSKVAFNLNVNEFSDPVNIEGNYYIIYVYDRYEAEPLPFEEVKELVESDLLSSKKSQIYTDYFESKKEAYDIKVF